MEVKIRGIDAGTIAKLDEQAKKKGMSRNGYIRAILEAAAINEQLAAAREQKADFEKAVYKSLVVINRNIIKLGEKK